MLAAFGLLIEVMSAATTFPLFLASVMAIGLGFAELGRRWLRSRALTVAGFAFALGFLALRFVALSPAKPFCEFHRDLEVGMSRQRVLELLDRHFPAGGRFAHPTVSEMKGGYLAITLNARSADWDSEFIDVQFENGRLVSSQYLPD